MTLPDFAAGEAFAVLLVFARIGAAMMFLPGFGEATIAPRIRLMIALGASLVLTPILAPRLPALPDSPVLLAAYIAEEIAAGAFLGLVARTAMSALATAGSIIAFQSSLANAFTSDPTTAQQAALPASVLTMIGVVLVFVTNFDHVLITALIGSYDLIAPGSPPPTGDMAQAFTKVVAESFGIGLAMAAPLVVVGLMVSLGMGLLARLMPQVQIFFIAAPAQTLLGFAVLAVTLPALMLWFMGQLGPVLNQAFGGSP
ncbi:MAG TPA: flagellar biosynthetic protein FliR [Alphaproteobacteria bacterium]|nr:flagellar biosynthetic protein FliR [Alphaproteobacteria bacterium]